MDIDLKQVFQILYEKAQLVEIINNIVRTNNTFSNDKTSLNILRISNARTVKKMLKIGNLPNK